MADIFARNIFFSPISLWERFIFSSGFHMPYLACAGSHVSLACSSNVVVEILLGVYVGNKVFGGLCVGNFVGSVVFFSIWDICGL